MKYTYVFLGHGRTGSTSLWRMYRDHPQVAVSINKEHLQFTDMTTIEDYNQGFIINNNTRVLLNGVTNSTKYCLDFVKQATKESLDARVCCIYVLRNPIDRLISYYDLVNKANTRRQLQLEPVFTDDSLDLMKLQMNILNDIHEYAYLQEIERAIGLDNILVIKLEDIKEKQSKVCEFLKIDVIDLKFQKLNTTHSFTPTVETLQDKLKIIDLIKTLLTEKTIKDISDEQIELIHKRYNVI